MSKNTLQLNTESTGQEHFLLPLILVLGFVGWQPVAWSTCVVVDDTTAEEIAYWIEAINSGVNQPCRMSPQDSHMASEEWEMWVKYADWSSYSEQHDTFVHSPGYLHEDLFESQFHFQILFKLSEPRSFHFPDGLDVQYAGSAYGWGPDIAGLVIRNAGAQPTLTTAWPNAMGNCLIRHSGDIWLHDMDLDNPDVWEPSAAYTSGICQHETTEHYQRPRTIVSLSKLTGFNHGIRSYRLVLAHSQVFEIQPEQTQADTSTAASVFAPEPTDIYNSTPAMTEVLIHGNIIGKTVVAGNGFGYVDIHRPDPWVEYLDATPLQVEAVDLVQQWDGTWLLSGQFHNARRGVLKVTYEVDPFPHDGQTNSMKWFKVLDTVYSYTAAGTATGTFSVLLHEGLTFASSSGNLMSFHDGSLQTSIPVYYSSPEPLGRVPLPDTNTPVAPDRGVTPTDPVGDYRPGPAGDVPPAR